MKRFLVAAIAMAIAGAVGAQTKGAATADDAAAKKTEPVKSSIPAHAKPKTHKASAPKQSSKSKKSKRLTNEEGQQVMQNLQNSAKDEYRPAFPPPR